MTFKLPKFYFLVNPRTNERTNGIPMLETSRDYIRYKDEYRSVECDWQMREHLRFEHNVYRQVPRWFPTVDGHWAHPSVHDPRLISFTENPEKGEADVRVVMRPGRYIERFFPGKGLSAQELGTRWAAHFKPEVLMFAKSADEIEAAFTRGPKSCMSYPAEYFAPYGAKHHPVRAYGDSDLQLAYIEREGKITARCLVWPESKLHGRIYGDEFRIRPLLAQEGYTEGKFVNAKIVSHPTGKGWTVPYIDWIERGSETEDKSFIILDGKGPIRLQNQYGVYAVGKFDPWSGQYLNDEDFYRVITENGGQIWSTLRIAAMGFRCAYSGDYYANHYRVEMANGEGWARDYFRKAGKTCAGNGLNYPSSEGVVLKKGWYSHAYLKPRIEEQKKAA